MKELIELRGLYNYTTLSTFNKKRMTTNSTNDMVKQLQNNKELRPLFIDFVMRGFAVGMTDTFEVHHTQRIRYQQEYYSALAVLSKEVEKIVSPTHVLPMIENVSTWYLSRVGKIGFENYRPEKN